MNVEFKFVVIVVVFWTILLVTAAVAAGGTTGTSGGRCTSTNDEQTCNDLFATQSCSLSSSGGNGLPYCPSLGSTCRQQCESASGGSTCKCNLDYFALKYTCDGSYFPCSDHPSKSNCEMYQNCYWIDEDETENENGNENDEPIPSLATIQRCISDSINLKGKKQAEFDTIVEDSGECSPADPSLDADICAWFTDYEVTKFQGICSSIDGGYPLAHDYEILCEARRNDLLNGELLTFSYTYTNYVECFAAVPVAGGGGGGASCNEIFETDDHCESLGEFYKYVWEQQFLEDGFFDFKCNTAQITNCDSSPFQPPEVGGGSDTTDPKVSLCVDEAIALKVNRVEVRVGDTKYEYKFECTGSDNLFDKTCDFSYTDTALEVLQEACISEGGVAVAPELDVSCKVRIDEDGELLEHLYSYTSFTDCLPLYGTCPTLGDACDSIGAVLAEEWKRTLVERDGYRDVVCQAQVYECSTTPSIEIEPSPRPSSGPSQGPNPDPTLVSDPNPYPFYLTTHEVTEATARLTFTTSGVYQAPSVVINDSATCSTAVSEVFTLDVRGPTLAGVGLMEWTVEILFDTELVPGSSMYQDVNDGESTAVIRFCLHMEVLTPDLSNNIRSIDRQPYSASTSHSVNHSVSSTVNTAGGKFELTSMSVIPFSSSSSPEPDSWSSTTEEPTSEPSPRPSPMPTDGPTGSPSTQPSPNPSSSTSAPSPPRLTAKPTTFPTSLPTKTSTLAPTSQTGSPSLRPSAIVVTSLQPTSSNNDSQTQNPSTPPPSNESVNPRGPAPSPASGPGALPVVEISGATALPFTHLLKATATVVVTLLLIAIDN